MKPTSNQHPAYFSNYINKVEQQDLLLALRDVKQTLIKFVDQIKPEQENFAYADGKWTIKEVIVHCMDTERVFAFRAMSFARGEKQKMLSFDENVYAANCNAQHRNLQDIVEEFATLMDSTYLLFKSFSENTLNQGGEMQSGYATVNALGFVICGHTLHHLGVLKDRYLNEFK